jgi:hypothetical protein
VVRGGTLDRLLAGEQYFECLPDALNRASGTDLLYGLPLLEWVSFLLI